MTWFLYIVSNNSHTTYIGITNDLIRRVDEHKRGEYPNGFTARYTFDRLVYYEGCASQREATRREKQLKAWSRAKKVALIQKMNPNWLDLNRSYLDAMCLK